MAAIPDNWLSRNPPAREQRATAGRWLRAPVLARALLAQAGGFVLAWSALPPGPAAAMLHGAAAALAGELLGLPRWWRLFNVALPLLACAGLALRIEPAWFLAAFVVAFAMFGSGSLRSGVPLYFSGSTALDALLEVLPDGDARVLDAGSGIGSVLAGIARRRPGLALQGIESAFLPWLVSRLRAPRGGAAYRVSHGDFWDADFGAFDVVYLFLSSAAMPRAWDKAQREMRPGSLLVSNVFEVPGVAPDRSVEYGDGDRLLAWRM